MNIFETLGPKLRKAILLTESNRAMREMLKGNIHPMALQRKGMLRPAESMVARAGNLQEGFTDKLWNVASGIKDTVSRAKPRMVPEKEGFRIARNESARHHQVPQAQVDRDIKSMRHAVRRERPDKPIRGPFYGHENQAYELPPDGPGEFMTTPASGTRFTSKRGAKAVELKGVKPASNEVRNRDIQHEVNHLTRGKLKGPLPMNMDRVASMTPDERFDYKGRLRFINLRRRLRDEAKASAGLVTRGPKGVKGNSLRAAFGTYTMLAPNKFFGKNVDIPAVMARHGRKVAIADGRAPDMSRPPISPEQSWARKHAGPKTPLWRYRTSFAAKDNRRELAERLRNFRKAGGLYPEGLENKSWLKLSAVARAGNLQEALSEQTRAMIPKNKFAAPTMERVGHADKGLYPIFDKTSAKSALKLSGKHPHLKREITRRAAVYGVKPEKKGTKYA